MTVAEWLFPGWASPTAIAGFVAVRMLCSAGLVGVIAAIRGRQAPLTAAAAATALLAAGLLIAVLRGTAGQAASFLEVGLQLLLVAVTGTLAATETTSRRIRIGAVVGILVTLVLLAASVPLYGEATVAP